MFSWFIFFKSIFLHVSVSCVLQTSMSAGTILDGSVLTNVTTLRGRMSAAAPQASDCHMMAGTVKVRSFFFNWIIRYLIHYDRVWLVCPDAGGGKVRNVFLCFEDVNECEANPCSQECANVYGSYQCYCRRGYQLSDLDGVTCEGADDATANRELSQLKLSQWVLTIPLCCSQISMSVLCPLEVTCARTAAPTLQEAFIVPAHLQGTPSPTMDAHAKVSGGLFRPLGPDLLTNCVCKIKNCTC